MSLGKRLGGEPLERVMAMSIRLHAAQHGPHKPAATPHFPAQTRSQSHSQAGSTAIASISTLRRGSTRALTSTKVEAGRCAPK